MYTFVYFLVHKVMRQGDSEVKVMPVRLADKIVEILDERVQGGVFANRSAAIRVIVTHYILKEENRI